MNDLATVTSGWGEIAFPILAVLLPICLFLSPLADLITNSYWLLALKVLLFGAVFTFQELVEPIWLISMFIGLAFVSFIRAFRWLKQSERKPNKSR